MMVTAFNKQNTDPALLYAAQANALACQLATYLLQKRFCNRTGQSSVEINKPISILANKLTEKIIALIYKLQISTILQKIQADLNAAIQHAAAIHCYLINASFNHKKILIFLSASVDNLLAATNVAKILNGSAKNNEVKQYVQLIGIKARMLKLTHLRDRLKSILSDKKAKFKDIFAVESELANKQHVLDLVKNTCKLLAFKTDFSASSAFIQQGITGQELHVNTLKMPVKWANKLTRLFALFVMTSMFTNTTLYAQESSQRDLSEEDYIGDVPKVLTISRLSQASADAAAAVTIISRETIRASGIVDLPEIFRLVPGFYVGANAGYVYSTDYAVSYHGLNSAYVGTMQVMINGRSVYSPLYGGVKWSELPLAIADIERIEITRGPNAASYGANAFQGVINIITQVTDGATRNRIIATHGNGRNEVSYSHSGKQNALDYRVTAGYREDEGIDNRNDFKRTRFMNAQANATINLTNSLEFELGVADGARGEGNIANDSIVFLPRTKQVNNYYGLIRWQHQVTDTSDLTVQAYHSYDRSNDSTTTINLRPIIAGLSRRIANNLVENAVFIKNEVIQQRTDIEAQHTFAIGDDIRAVWGGSIRQDTMYAPFYLNSRNVQTFDLQRLFGHVEWQAHPKITFNTGAMLENNDFTGTDLSPRASVNFKLYPDHTIRLGISSALRTPNYVEEKFQDRLTINTKLANPKALIFQFRANPGNLDPEQIISREIGYLGKFGHLNLDVRLFNERYSHVIRGVDRTDFTVPANTILLNPNDVRFSENSGSAEMNGAEFQTNWRVSTQTQLLLNYAYTHIRQTRPRLKVEYVDAMPRNTLSALITHRFNQQWDGSLIYYQTSQAHLLGDGNKVDLIRRADVRLARQFNSGLFNANFGAGEFSVVVENLFNNHYEEFADYNTLKRRARVNVKLDF